MPYLRQQGSKECKSYTKERRGCLNSIKQLKACQHSHINFARKSLASDVTIVPSPQSCQTNFLCTKPGQILITAFNNKCRHTLEAFSDKVIVFVLVCQESLGGYQERSASAQSIAKGTDETETIKHFFQKLSIILQKVNCFLLFSCAPCPYYDPHH